MTTGMEIEYGSVAVIVGLIAGYLTWKVRKPKDQYGKFWGPLAPVINGSAQGSRLSGTYQGMPILARIGGEQNGDTPNFFYELTATPGPASSDWSLSFTGEKFLGTGTKTWRVKSKDDALRQRLTEAGAAAALADWPSQPEISYKGKTGTLHYWERADGMYDLPSVETFQAQLELLSKLSALNRQVNI